MQNEVFQRGSEQNTFISVLPFVHWCVHSAAELKGRLLMSLRCLCILDASYLFVRKLCNCGRIVGKPPWLSMLLSKGGRSSMYFDTARGKTSDANRKNCQS